LGKGLERRSISFDEVIDARFEVHVDSHDSGRMRLPPRSSSN
jgi:hypothetical protein